MIIPLNVETENTYWVLMSYLIDEYNKKKDNIKTRKYPWNL